MLEAGTVFKTDSTEWLFKEDYNWSKGSYKKTYDDRAIATIREYSRCNVADVRLNAQNANAVTSIVQTFDDAAATVCQNLSEMQTLAEKAVNGYYSYKEKASVQKQLKELSKSINSIVDNTKYDSNKLFTADGKVISASIGKGRTIKLFAKDLSFDAEKVDLAGNTTAAVTHIKNALKEANEYSKYLNSQSGLLESAMSTIELEMASAVGVKSGNFDIKVSEEWANYLAYKIPEDRDKSFRVQFNVPANLAAMLLKNLEEDTQEDTD